MRGLKTILLVIKLDGELRRVAKIRIGKGEFFLIPEQRGAKVRCGGSHLDMTALKSNADLSLGHDALPHGFHLSFHRSGRVHARGGEVPHQRVKPQYACVIGCPLDEMPRAMHVATIQMINPRDLPPLGRPLGKGGQSNNDLWFQCPPTMARGHFPIFLSNELDALDSAEFNRVIIFGGLKPLCLGTRLMGYTEDWNCPAHDLLVIGGWDPRRPAGSPPNQFVWVTVSMAPGSGPK